MAPFALGAERCPAALHRPPGAWSAIPVFALGIGVRFLPVDCRPVPGIACICQIFPTSKDLQVPRPRWDDDLDDDFDAPSDLWSGGEPRSRTVARQGRRPHPPRNEADQAF